MDRLLRAYLEKRDNPGPNDLLIVSSLDDKLWRYSVGKRIRAYGAAAGIQGKRVSPHTLRHTFAVSWLLGGGDALSLQKLLGHSSQVMTARYVSFTAGDLAKLHRSISPIDRLRDAGGAVPAPFSRQRRRIR